jgi:bacillolysin
MTRMLATFIVFLLAACVSGNPESKDNRLSSSPKSMQQISLDYLNTLPEYTQFKQSALQLKLKSSKQDQLGMTHLRYQQEFQSVPLLDAEIITHIKNNKVYRMDGHLAKLNLTSVQPSITKKQAVVLALQAKNLTSSYKVTESLVIVSTTNPYDRLAWLVTLKNALQRYIFLIDANTGSIIREIPGIYTSTIK